MTTRRRFFQLLAGAALAPVAAKAAAVLPSVPMLHGDGAHDDTEALNALLRGDVVEFSDRLTPGGWGVSPSGDPLFRLPQGVYRTTASVSLGDLPKRTVVDLRGTKINADFDADFGISFGVQEAADNAVLAIGSGKRVMIMHPNLQVGTGNPFEAFPPPTGAQDAREGDERDGT